MTIASEFIEMAKEMLDDPEIGSDGTLTDPSATVTDPSKPWETTPGSSVTYPMRLFYDTQKRNNVNGSLIVQGEKVFIAYEPDGVNLERTIGWKFTDHTGRDWKVNAVEAISAGNTNVICYVKIGS